MQARLIYTFFCIVFRSCPCVSSFITGGAQLPRETYRSAVGYDESTDTILLVGGFDTDRQFVKFKDSTFTDMGETYLNANQYTYGYSQHYTQINNDLWMIHPEGSNIMNFNTETYTVETLSTTIPNNVLNRGCLTSTDTHLIVFDMDTSVQIYSITDDKWLSNIPSLQNKRRRCACVVVNDTVYAIGGWMGLTGSGHDSIEVLDLSNIDMISSQTWEYLSGRLNTARDSVRAVVYGTDIYVIGGHFADSYYVDINIIDTITGECDVGESLAFKASYSSPIIVGNMLYVFGGQGSEVPLIESRYQYCVLPTLTAITTTQTSTSTEGQTSIQPPLTSTFTSTLTINDTRDTMVHSTLTLSTYLLYIWDDAQRNETIQGTDVFIIVAVLIVVCMTPSVVCVFYRGYKKGEVTRSHQNIDPVVAMQHELGIQMEPSVHKDSYIYDIAAAASSEGNMDTANIGKDEFIVSGEDEEAERLSGDTANIAKDEFIVSGDNEKDGDVTKEGGVYTWLESIGCITYYDVFLMNGFNSLDFVKQIRDVTHLEAMGINLIEHQLKIVNSIKHLQ